MGDGLCADVSSLAAHPVFGLSLARGSIPAWNEVMGGGMATERSKFQNFIESLSTSCSHKISQGVC